MLDQAVEIRFSLHPAPDGANPEGKQARPVIETGRLPRITQVVALALHFQEMLRRGEAKDYADLARLGAVTRERMSQIMKLQWLAPDIQQDILYLPPAPAGRYPISETAIRKIANVLSWTAQRHEWLELKKSHRLLHQDTL
jgi:hypothetical protein